MPCTGTTTYQSSETWVVAYQLIKAPMVRSRTSPLPHGIDKCCLNRSCNWRCPPGRTANSLIWPESRRLGSLISTDLLSSFWPLIWG